jgi:hypothetical protein
MTNIFRVASLSAGLLAIASFTSGANGSSQTISVDQVSANRHLSGLMARITMRDGTTRTIKLEGVGCTRSICSRTVIKAKSESDSMVKTWFDGLAGIQDTTSRDALFVMRDGTSKRMSLLTDFRVLYFANRFGRPERLDLGAVKSVEFVTPTGSR